jgi:pyruvate dehydrogenase E2 component (dihydrolipoamide acetyltransferase)
MKIVMPKLGLTMTEGTLTRWLKTAGEPVKEGEIIFEFESDKSIMEYEAPADGTLGEILIDEGETVPCGTPLADFIPAREAAQAPSGRSSNLPAAEPEVSKAASPAVTPFPGRIIATPAAKRRARELQIDLATITGRGPGGRIQQADVEAAAQAGQTASTAISRSGTPVAKRAAAELGVDWVELTGSGTGGRVVKADVLAAAQRPANAAPETAVEVSPLTGLRSIIARRMSDSAFSAPHVTLFTEADATTLVEARAQLNAELAESSKISYNSFLIAIAARALREHPRMNACLAGEEIRRYQEVNIALAVDTDRGLLAPVIRQADRLDLPAIEEAGGTLIQRAISGKSLPDDLTGGTFTITNLGMYEIDGFTPIINQPQAAILGAGRIKAKPVVVANEVLVRQMMGLSLSFDHRLVDGGPAARFLQRLKQLIERPFALMASPPQA